MSCTSGGEYRFGRNLWRTDDGYMITSSLEDILRMYVAQRRSMLNMFSYKADFMDSDKLCPGIDCVSSKPSEEEPKKYKTVKVSIEDLNNILDAR